MARTIRRASIPSAFRGPRDTGGKIPMLFQIVGPDLSTLLLPEAMYLHVNPESLDTSYEKTKEQFQTLGGFHEQHWGDELSEISADQSSGAFLNVDSGLAVHRRRRSIAYRKTAQMKQLFENNGNAYDEDGAVRFRGRIRLMFEGGIFDGAFQDIDFSESSDQPFAFKVSWSFRVESESRNLLI